MKISNNFFSFFSSRNQFFPHIPYVASKNQRRPFRILPTLPSSWPKSIGRVRLNTLFNEFFKNILKIYTVKSPKPERF
jgi:hypothetical protein